MTDRAEYIGSSDVAGILGISPWRTPFDTWAEHVHDPSWQPQEETIQMRVGTYMEAFLADEYTRQTGRVVRDRQMEFIHGLHQFLRVHVDGLCHEEGGIVEFKTAGSSREWGSVEEPVIPEHYQAQCFFALGLTGAKWCDVSVLLPRGDFRTIRLEADEAVQQGIIAAMVSFWNDHVLTKRPPEIDTSQSAARWLARMPDDQEEALEAGAELEEVIEKLAGVRQAIKKLEPAEELLTNQAKALIGEYQRAVGRGWHVTYKRNRPFETTDWKAATKALEIEMQLRGFADEAAETVHRYIAWQENRRPFVLKRDDEGD